MTNQEVLEDRELVAAILSGEQERFAELVERYERRLVNYVYRMIRNYEDAHDLAQEIFIKVYMALDRYDPKYKFSTWIFRIAQNAAIDQIRKKTLPEESLTKPDRDSGGERQMQIEADVVSPYRAVFNVEMAGAIESAVQNLPEDYRELIELRHFAELSYDEIAEVKQLPLGTVKNKLFRARNMLKEQLDQYMESV
ncbi:MAG: sigma-70 family RNA polymerase sigma factor [Thermoanaerobaculia bacterium]|nr:sigma-70 family RNA polymerase sigma factor [Thermoanaerobaculia bacterium]